MFKFNGDRLDIRGIDELIIERWTKELGCARAAIEAVLIREAWKEIQKKAVCRNPQTESSSLVGSL